MYLLAQGLNGIAFREALLEDVAGELTWCGVKSTDPKTEDCEFTDAGVSESVSAYPVVTFTWGHTRAKYDFLGLDPFFDARNAASIKAVTCSYRLTEAGYNFISGSRTSTISGHKASVNGTTVEPLTNGSYTKDWGGGSVDTYVECPPSK
jgi:hypothetical protein